MDAATKQEIRTEAKRVMFEYLTGKPVGELAGKGEVYLDAFLRTHREANVPTEPQRKPANDKRDQDDQIEVGKRARTSKYDQARKHMTDERRRGGMIGP